MILRLLSQADLEAGPDLLPSLGMGFFFTWCREAEISADRAGLLCCQDADAARQALLRLLHGLPADSPWIDPKHPEFDPAKVVASFRRWENEPFVKFWLTVRKLGAAHPFIPQRIASLTLWAKGEKYRWIYGVPRHGAAYIWFKDDEVVRIRQ